MWKITDWLKWKSAYAVVLSVLCDARTEDVLDRNNNSTGSSLRTQYGITPRGGAAGQDAPDGSAAICVDGGAWGYSCLQVSKMWSSDFLFTSRQINLLKDQELNVNFHVTSGSLLTLLYNKSFFTKLKLSRKSIFKTTQVLCEIQSLTSVSNRTWISSSSCFASFKKGFSVPNWRDKTDNNDLEKGEPTQALLCDSFNLF